MDYLLIGIQYGLSYSLFAVGLVLVWRASRVLNFAYADIATAGAFFYWWFHQLTNSFLVSALAGILISSLISFLFCWFVLDFATRKGVNQLGLTIITLGFGFAIQGINLKVWGADPKTFPFPWSGRELFVATVVITSLTVALLWLLLSRTKIGIKIRAVSQNLDAARVLAINTRFILSLTWALAGGLGALAGMLLAPTYYLDPFYLFPPFVKAFVGAVLGGLDSPPGAIVGSILVGIAESLFGGYISLQFKEALVFAIILAILILRPEGIFGKKIEERV